MGVQAFTLGYFIWVLLAVGLFLGFYYAFRNKSETFKYRLLLGLAIFTWVIHFSRYLLDPDLRTYTLFFEDFCGFNTMMMPFLLLLNTSRTKSFMFYNGALFALHSLLYPNNIFGDPYFSYNTIRFFFAHFLLVSIPLWLIAFKMYTPKLKEVPWNFVYLLVGALYCFMLSYVLYHTGLTMSPRNYMGLWGGQGTVYEIAETLAPMFRYKVEVDGETVTKAIPFIYMLPTLVLIYVPVWVLMALPFQIKKVKDS